MGTIRNLQLFSFGDFVNSQWRRAQGRIESRADNDLDAIMAAASWVEVLTWLSLGLEIGAYPNDEAQRLLGLSRASTEQCVRRYERELTDLLTPPILAALPEFFRRGRLSIAHSFEQPRKLIPVFSTACALASRMDYDAVGFAFRRTLILERDSFWIQCTEGPASFSSVDALLKMDDAVETLCPEVLIAGFIRSIEMMDQWAAAFETLRVDENIPIGDRSGLRRYIAQSTRWRMSLHEESTRARFLGVAKIVCEFLADASSVSISTTLDEEKFIQRVNQMVDTWNHDHELLLTAGV
jgi:hypothetical protein